MNKRFYYEAEKDNDGVIRKVGNKWRILKKNRKDYWDAEYDTKADAQAALRAYWVNKKGESRLSKRFYTKNESVLTESSKSNSIKNLAKTAWKHKGENVDDFLDWLYDAPIGISYEEACFIIALKLKMDGETRLKIWDTIMSFIPKKDKKAHELVIDSYYHFPSEIKDENDIIKKAFYYLWHDSFIYNAIHRTTDPEEFYALSLMLPEAKINGRGEVSHPTVTSWVNKNKKEESTIKNIKNSLKKESLKSLRHGDLMLHYDGDDIDWNDFEEDVFNCFKIKNANFLVLKNADEVCSDEEMEEEIIAEGDDALEEFYESCLLRLQEDENGDVAIFLYDANKITNFYYELCLK